MLNKFALTFAVAVLSTACLAESSTSMAEPEGVFESAPVDLVSKLRADLQGRLLPSKLNAPIDLAEVCPIIASEGPCAVACDPDALARLIPTGMCVTFSCVGVDGDSLRVGGCNLGDAPESAPSVRATTRNNAGSRGA